MSGDRGCRGRFCLSPGGNDSFRFAALVLLILSAFLGSAFLTLAVGSFSVFPYRVLLFGIGVCVLSGHARLIRFSGTLKLGSPLVLAGMAMAYASITLLWTPDLGMGIRHLALLAAGLAAALLVADMARTETTLRAVMGAWLVGAGLLLLIAIPEHIFGIHLPKSVFYGTPDWRFLHVPTATFVNPNDLAALMALTIPFAGSVFRYAGGRIVPWTGLVLAVSCFYIILVTESRAAFLAVICEIAVLAFFSLRRGRRARRGGILLLGLGVAFAIATFSPFVPVEPDPDFVLPPAGELESMEIRVNLALNGWEAITSTRGLGVGIGGWESWFDANAVFATEEITAPHNWWLELGTELGIPFLLVYIAVYLTMIWRAWQAWRAARSRRERMLTETALLGLVGFSVACLGPSSFLAFAPQWLFWGFAAAVLAWVRRVRTAEEKK